MANPTPQKQMDVKMVTDSATLSTCFSIGRRAVALAIQMKIPLNGRDILSFTMDIEATHCNGNPLRLQELLEADDANFGHDVFGINKYLNRDTGKLSDHFMPRFSAPQHA